MKITIKNAVVVASIQSLNRLLEYKLPVLVSMEVMKVAHSLDVANKLVNECITKLRKDYGEKNEIGQFVVKAKIPNPAFNKENKESKEPEMIPNPKLAEFNAEVEALLMQEVEIEFAKKIKLPEKIAATCDKCHHNMDKPLEIEPAILLGLIDFIDV